MNNINTFFDFSYDSSSDFSQIFESQNKKHKNPKKYSFEDLNSIEQINANEAMKYLISLSGIYTRSNVSKSDILNISMNETKAANLNGGYLKDPMLYFMLPGDLTIYKARHDAEKAENYFILLKGKRKIFDFEYSFFNKIHYGYTKKSIKFLDREDNRKGKYFIYPIIKAIDSGDLIQMSKQVRLKGVPVNISYSAQYQGWVICSKNVSVVTQKKGDLLQYIQLDISKPLDRIYRHLFILAQHWGDTLEAKEESKVEAMKTCLTDKTICGVYVNNVDIIDTQVKAPKAEIIFNCIVKNYSTSHCIPIDKAEEFFKDHDLPFTKANIILTTNELGLGADKLHMTYGEISESAGDKASKGVILYFTIVNNGSYNQTKVCSIAKVISYEAKFKKATFETLKKVYDKGISHIRPKTNLLAQCGREISIAVKNNQTYLQGYYYDQLKRNFDGITDHMSKKKNYEIKASFQFLYDLGIKSTVQSAPNSVDNRNKNIEIFLLAPPLYLPKDFKELIEEGFSTQVKSYYDQNDKSIGVKMYRFSDYKGLEHLDTNQYALIFSFTQVQENNIKACGIQWFKSCKKRNNIPPNHLKLFYHAYFQGKFEDYFTEYVEECNRIADFLNMRNHKQVIMFDQYDESNQIVYLRILEMICENQTCNIELKEAGNRIGDKHDQKSWSDPENSPVDNEMKNAERKRSRSIGKCGDKEYTPGVGFGKREAWGNKEFKAFNNKLPNKGTSSQRTPRIDISKRGINAIKNKNNVEFFTSVIKNITQGRKSPQSIQKPATQGQLNHRNNNNKSNKNNNKNNLIININNIIPRIQIPQLSVIRPSQSQTVFLHHKTNPDISADLFQNLRKQIGIFIPICIYGTGKTTLIDCFESISSKYKIPFYSISNDTIGRDIMNSLYDINPQKTISLLMKESVQHTSNIIKLEGELIMNKIFNNPSTTSSIVFIDKCFTKYAVLSYFEMIKNIGKRHNVVLPSKEIKFIKITPECSRTFRFNDQKDFIPFSGSYLVQCYLRVKHRSNHPLLNGHQVDGMGVFGVLLKDFFNLSLDRNIIKSVKFDWTLKLGFTDEKNENYFMNDELEEKMKQFLAALKGNYKMSAIDYGKQIDAGMNRYTGNDFNSTKEDVEKEMKRKIKLLFEKR